MNNEGDRDPSYSIQVLLAERIIPSGDNGALSSNTLDFYTCVAPLGLKSMVNPCFYTHAAPLGLRTFTRECYLWKELFRHGIMARSQSILPMLVRSSAIRLMSKEALKDFEKPSFEEKTRFHPHVLDVRVQCIARLV